MSKNTTTSFGWPALVVVLTIILTVMSYAFRQSWSRQVTLESTSLIQSEKIASAEAQIKDLAQQILVLESEDQRVKNNTLQKEIASLKAIYNTTLVQYEDILNLREQSASKTTVLENLLADILAAISKNDLKTAQDISKKLAAEITKEKSRLASLAQTAFVAIPASVPAKTTPPSSGFGRQKVTVEGLGDYLVDIVAGDLGSTKVIVDTASTGTCANNCPVMSLASYAARTGAYAGVNGSYFCPASYPGCAGKTNSFDLLLMNKDKVYFNSDNNVYSNNPGVVFGSGYIRFLSAVSGWGRDTGIDSMISNYPLLLSGGRITFGGNSDPKQGSRGNRSFVASKGNTVYIGVVHGVTVAESARVLKAMGMENALNLDSGGSTALWSGGYKVGPGRDLPNAILFVRK